jgi:hypothetical protein
MLYKLISKLYTPKYPPKYSPQKIHIPPPKPTPIALPISPQKTSATKTTASTTQNIFCQYIHNNLQISHIEFRTDLHLINQITDITNLLITNFKATPLTPNPRSPASAPTPSPSNPNSPQSPQTINPPHPIPSFLQEIIKLELIYPEHTDGILIYCIIILERIKKSGIPFNHYTIHKLIIIGLLITCKMYDDFYYDNKIWSEATGMNLKKLNNLERLLLHHINYDLIISDQHIKSLLKIIY